jgi:hypothetical protein
MCDLIHNDQGGITYAPQQRIGEAERRHATLGEVRMVIEGLTELCAEVRRSWPERYPMPPELDALLRYQDYALLRARSGELKRFAEVCES